MVSGSSPTHWARVVRPDRPAGEPAAQDVEDGPVDLVEAQLVDPEQLEAGSTAASRGDRPRRPAPRRSPAPAGAGGWRSAACPATARRSAGPRRRRPGTPRMPADRLTMAGQLVHVVVVEPADEPEAVAQRAGHQPGAGGGPHQGEAGQVEPDAPGGRTLADEDVELEVLHGRIEDLLDRAVQPVDLVDEQDVALLEVGEQGGQVAGPHQDRSGGDPQPGAHLGGHDAGQRRLAQAGWPGEQEVVGGLLPLEGRLDHDLEVLGQLALAHELGQRPRAEAGLLDLLGGDCRRVDRPRSAGGGSTGVRRRPRGLR